MKTTLHTSLRTLAFAPAQSGNGLTVYPIVEDAPPRMAYVSLARAIRDNLLVITEVSDAGTVPTLAAVNVSDTAILLVAGEELAGAKQNRILNTTILVPARSELKVPVSCTEQGRWSYSSPRFDDSQVMAARSVRLRKMESVSESLRMREAYDADQSGIWSDINDIHFRLNVNSPSGAMRDAFRERLPDLDRAMASFPRVHRQRGMAVAHGGRMLGIDVVSRADAFEDLHRKLIASFVIDMPDTASAPVREVSLDEMISDLVAAAATEHQSPGLGTDLRLTGQLSYGSALVHAEETVHLSCFVRNGGNTHPPGDRMASYMRRRAMGW
jgi:hypothetical protein